MEVELDQSLIEKLRCDISVVAVLQSTLIVRWKMEEG